MTERFTLDLNGETKSIDFPDGTAANIKACFAYKKGWTENISNPEYDPASSPTIADPDNEGETIPNPDFVEGSDQEEIPNPESQFALVARMVREYIECVVKPTMIKMGTAAAVKTATEQTDAALSAGVVVEK